MLWVLEKLIEKNKIMSSHFWLNIIILGGIQNGESSRKDNISSRGRLPDTRPNIGETEQNVTTGQIRHVEAGLHQGTQERSIYRTNVERNFNESSSRSRQDSTEENKSNDSRVSTEESSKRTNESYKSNEMGSNDEQLQKSSRGDSTSGDNLQLNLFTDNKTEEEQKKQFSKRKY